MSTQLIFLVLLIVLLVIYAMTEDNYLSNQYWITFQSTSAQYHFNIFIYKHLPHINSFSVIYSSNIYVNVIFLLSYCLFSRDQAFYLAFTLSFTTLFCIVLEVTFQQPQFIMRLPPGQDVDVDQEIIQNF